MPHVIIGDEAFPLKTYLMRPYPGSQEADLIKSNFNKRLSRARKVVENAFAILAQKFPLYNRRIQLKPENAEKVILTTCILHNFIKTGGNVNFHIQDETSPNMNRIPRQGGNSQDAAFRIRERFARFLNSPEGRMG
jgi:hypothetical protein